jgi:hypothetical protein
VIDQREEILSQLVTVCSGVSGIANAVRNRLDVSRLDRPAVVIFDGTEQLQSLPQNIVRSDIQLMELTPALSIHIRGGANADGGALLSLYRSRILAAVLQDGTLIDLVGNNGQIRYEGATVAPPAAEGNEHRMDLVIVFKYVFRLTDIAAP